MDLSMGMEGFDPTEIFQPTGIDAVNALLGQMPAMVGQAFAQKMRGRQVAERGETQRQELERGAVSQEQQRYDAMQRERKRKEQEALLAAREEERKRLLAHVAGARQLHTTYGGPTGFNPDQAIADYYQYGGGSGR